MWRSLLLLLLLLLLVLLLLLRLIFLDAHCHGCLFLLRLFLLRLLFSPVDDNKMIRVRAAAQGANCASKRLLNKLVNDLVFCCLLPLGLQTHNQCSLLSL